MLANIGKTGFPCVVYYILPGVTVIFSKLHTDQEIRVETKAEIGIKDLRKFVRENDFRLLGSIENRGKSCLILELAEDGNDPSVGICTLVTVSTRLAGLTLKTFMKGCQNI